MNNILEKILKEATVAIRRKRNIYKILVGEILGKPTEIKMRY
jgi:hypothetical protein